MLSLRGLRLNCWLAGCVPGVLAAVLLLLLGDRIGAAHRDVYAQGLQEVLQAHAAHAAHPGQVYAGPGSWTGVQRVLIDAEGGLTPRDIHGEVDMDILNPDPQLYDAVTLPQVWQGRGGQVRAAVAQLDEDGSFKHLLYAEARRTLEEGRNWIALVATAILALSAAMGWYLVRRVYLPVEDLCVQADAALRGRMIPQRYASRETEAAATAVQALATAYVSGQEAAVVPAPAQRSDAAAPEAPEETGAPDESELADTPAPSAASDQQAEPPRRDPPGEA
ncbi:MAG: hypothetical protein EA401_10780 [Planctomycetota bacterium]|nr:MAG: hypothetical protein EA401_10780 [Planctomycetota bacterium]